MKRDAVLAAVLVALLIAVSLLTAKPPATPKAATHAADDFGFGGYRGWSDLLAREGVRVTRFRRHHDALDGAGLDSLVMSFPANGVPYVWGAGERDALHAWIRAGGRLIDVGVTPSTSKDDGKDEPIALSRKKGDAKSPLRGPWASIVQTLAARGTDRIAIKPHQQVETLLADRGGALVARYRLGRGEVISIANGAMFENRVLADGDDARLAYLVAAPRAPGGVVAFDEAIRGDIVDKPWYLALDVPERVALAFVALAGLLWLLYGIVPLGPPVRLRAPREPTSEEFLDAVAALYGRARARDHARDALLAGARRALERSARSPENAALAAQLAAAENVPVTGDAALVALARLSRIAREETVRATSPDRRSTAPAGGARARRRRR